MDLGSFHPLPKYARHVSQKATLAIDSVAFICPNCGKYVISDRSKGENPQITVSFIKYPKEDNRIQARLAWSGRTHIETLAYNAKPAERWLEKGWIIIDEDCAEKLSQFLDWRNPQKLASWLV